MACVVDWWIGLDDLSNNKWEAEWLDRLSLGAQREGKEEEWNTGWSRMIKGGLASEDRSGCVFLRSRGRGIRVRAWGHGSDGFAASTARKPQACIIRVLITRPAFLAFYPMLALCDARAFCVLRFAFELLRRIWRAGRPHRFHFCGHGRKSGGLSAQAARRLAVLRSGGETSARSPTSSLAPDQP